MFRLKLQYALWLSLGLAGCGKQAQQIVQRVAALTDKHETLHNKMLDCEERYCRQLTTLTDLESIKQLRPKMSAEAQMYRALGEQFLTTEGLTPEKLRGILERSQERQLDLNRRIKEQMDRLLVNDSDHSISLAIPHLEWFGVKIRFVGDADDVAHGRPRGSDVKGLVDRMKAEHDKGPPPEERAKQAAEAAQARIEEAKARMEAMRAKMGAPPAPGFGRGPITPSGPEIARPGAGDAKSQIEEAKARMEAMRAKMGQPPAGGFGPGSRQGAP